MKHNYLLLSIISLALLNSCKKDAVTNDQFVQEQGRTISSTTFYALGDNNTLDKYNTDAQDQLLNSVTISGLQSMEKINSIDFRPATGELYGVSDQSRIYIIQPETGRTRMIGTGPVVPQITGMTGFDFNPTVDRLRIVSSNGTNLRINPETGVVIVDGNINGASNAAVAGAAYLNNMAGATTTSLFDIDVNSDKLFKQIPPNAGTLVEVGPLHIDVEGEGGFDISPDGVALAIFMESKKSLLFTVDLMSGTAKKIGKFSKDINYIGLAIPTNPVAYAISGSSLSIFNPMNQSAEILKTISGLQPDENLVGIDFRPLNGQIFAISNNSRLYTINTSNGAATFVATLSVALSGTAFGMDFNPVVDRIRIVSNTGQNLRVNPATGIALTDGNLNPGTPMISAAAYANNFAGTTSTTLFVLDANEGKLFVQSPPNSGTLSFIGNTGFNASSSNGFDIGSTSNMGFAILQSGEMSALYSVNLMNGMTEQLRMINNSNGFTIGLGF